MFVMEGVFPRNIYLRIIIQAPLRAEYKYIFLKENENKLDENQTGYWRQKLNNHDIPEIKVIDLCRVKNLTKTVIDTVALFFRHISMLKRSYSMEFDSEYKSEPTQGSGSGKDDETIQISKKICNSNYEERKSPADLDGSVENNRSSSHGRVEPYMRFPQGSENVHVTQSRSIFSHEDSFVYGNPKEEIKSIESSPTGDAVGGMSSFESNSTNVLDLSCKTPKAEEEKTDGKTYHAYRRSNLGNESFLRSNIDITLMKKPSLPEQLQIAKIQQQQRRSMQQQQKLLQQMKRSLDPKVSRQETCHKNVKYTGNNTTNHEQNDLDNYARVKDEFHPPIPGVHFPQFPYPYFDPNHPKELPDNHPILPLLDPVYFSALYNAHGYLPPSSPSIAAAFIGTLQDALPKLPMMFPSTSSNNSSLSPQKGNDNPN